MSENTNESPAASPKGGEGAWTDLMLRLKGGEKAMIAAVVACAVAALQLLIGATGGVILTTAMLFNLALIGWLGNTAFARKGRGEGNGLLLLTGVAFILAAVSTLFLAQGVSDIARMAQGLEEMGNAFGDFDVDFDTDF